MFKRIYKLHLAAEYLFEGLLGDATTVWIVQEPGSYFSKIHFRAYWWHPSTWIGWSRVVIFGDRHGSAYFTDRDKPSTANRKP